MTDDQYTQILLKKAGELGRAQARYGVAAIAFLVFGLWGHSNPFFGYASELAPFGIGLSLAAWFGIGRAAGEIAPDLKKQIEGYNYGKFGGAPPFIWALAYAPHGKGGIQRIAALTTYPLAFSVLLGYAFSEVLIGTSFSAYTVLSTLSLLPAVWMTIGLAINRLKVM